MQGNPATENQRIYRGRYGPVGAFKAAAALQHTTPERALAGMLAKHIVSLYDMCFDGDTDYDISTWNEKITDSLNYLFLLKAIVKEGHTNQPN